MLFSKFYLLFFTLFICTIFTAATYHLLRQKRMSDLNRDFFNHMAHEFRTPLTNIRLAGKMLAKKKQGLQASPYLKIIHQEGDHLMDQVEQVLHLARLEKNEFNLQRQPTNVNQLLQDTVKRMALRQAETKASIEVELPPTPVFLNIDPLHFGNAIRNLLDNAMKYCHQTPDIRLRLRSSPEAVRFSLSDNGQGLSEVESQKIFEKFYQSRHTPHRKGFGLGLSYVKRVIELHGGNIQVKCGETQGTRFDLILPREITQA